MAVSDHLALGLFYMTCPQGTKPSQARKQFELSGSGVRTWIDEATELHQASWDRVKGLEDAAIVWCACDPGYATV